LQLDDLAAQAGEFACMIGGLMDYLRRSDLAGTRLRPG
jgi:hypothetical protein